VDGRLPWGPATGVGFVQFGMLGALELRLDGSPVALDGERQRKLLALLLLNAGSAVPVDRLVDELWDEPPPTARRQVGNAAAGVRRTLGERLVTTPHGYLVRLGDDDQLDLGDFRDLVLDAAAEPPAVAVKLLGAALELWRGPLLDGLESPMIAAARSGLADQRLTAVERHAEAAREVGDAQLVIGELVGHVAANPLRESLRAALIRTLHKAGRPAGALAVFAEGQRLLAEQLGVDPGPALRAAHEEVLRADRAAAPATPTPSFLPLDTAHFVGRDAAIAEVLAVVSGAPTGRPAVVALEGMGGVGKTALAVHLAHRLIDRYPDGAHFLDLRGFTDGESPMPVDAALAALLWQTGVPADQVAADLGSRREQWRRLTVGKRLLVVLDNAADAAQARQLLPGSVAALVLVTSRRHLLDLEEAVPVAVDVLTSGAAAELFRRIGSDRRVDAEPEATAAVVRLCGGLPLAVRIAAARFRRRPAWTMAHLAEQLGDRQGRERTFAVDETGVAGTITLSYRDLPPARQRLFRLLGVIPGPDFDAGAVAAVADVPPAEARASLDALFERSLLVQRDADRYALHDLMRDYVRARSADEDTDADLTVAFERLSDYYARFVEVHCSPMLGYRPPPRVTLARPPAPVPEPTGPAQAVGRLRAEYASLVAAIGYADDRGWWEHVWRLPCLLLPYFATVGQRTGVGALADAALRAARQLGNTQAEAHALLLGAFALDEQGQHEGVCELLRRAVRLSMADGDLATAAAAHRDRGGAAHETARFAEAEREFARARELARAAGHVVCEMSATSNLALTLAHLGRHAEARDLFEVTLAHHRSTGAAGSEAAALINLAWLHHLDGQDTLGLTALLRALPLSRSAGRMRVEVIALAWLAVTYRRLGQLDKAVAAGRESCESARRFELQDPECEALNGLGEAYLAAGRPANATAAFEQAERIASTADLPMALARAWEGLAHVAAGRGDQERATRLWERALSMYPENMPDADQPRAHLAAAGDPRTRCTRCQSNPAEVDAVVG
jgi:DNA-binding SARP family transcriptional activator/tetratricopeptide (TPR) repeat protein